VTQENLDETQIASRERNLFRLHLCLTVWLILINKYGTERDFDLVALSLTNYVGSLYPIFQFYNGVIIAQLQFA